MKQSVQQSSYAIQEHDELILVVSRDNLFPQGAWSGIRPVNVDAYLHLIQAKKEFMPRSHMETDPTYKQIIPYLVYRHENRYFLMQRTGSTTEQRLKNKYSLGIGGHIRQEDIGSGSIVDWARREFHEEINFEGSFTVEPCGLLNDDSNDVGKVHAGFVFLLTGDSATISVKSELKSGALLTLSEIADFYQFLEPWSQLVFTYLSEKTP